MEAITREEKIISGENLTPITRKEMFLAKAAGMDVETPEPITREEMFLSKISVGGSGGGSGGEMTADGAEIYVITEGMCLSFLDFTLAMSGGGPSALEIFSTMRTLVRDELPLIAITGIGRDPLGEVFCVIDSSGLIYYEASGEWKSLSEGGLPQHGWIDKSELEALDATDANNMGLYVVRSSARYPMVDGTLTDLNSEAISVTGFFDQFLMLNTVDLPNATVLGNQAFRNCYSITSVNIPNVAVIGEATFDGCRSLTSITLPESLKFLGRDAFDKCTALSEIKYNGTVDQWNAIYKGEGWNYNIPATKVICSDGTVTLN